ncbi:MAG: hypothetical protein HY040_14380 [Planctomycetes bacterium]|nr:hypothetical protein [Planctomycetota bacterium]
MQCPSCRFENMPGLDACGRCGSNLKLATAVLDVEPPRATAWQKRLRRWLPWYSANRFRYAARDGRAAAADLLDEAGFPLPEPSILLRFLVPGWAHFFCGQKARGRLFLGAFLGLFGGGILCWGSGLGNFLLGLAVSVHASSVIDILFRRPAGIVSRLVAGFAVMLVLGVAIYFPAGWLATRVAMPVTVQINTPVFKAGEVLLVNTWATPKPGSLVLCSPPRTVGGVYIQAGQFIDRVLAGPGDRVLWENGQLFVNGQPSALSPVNPRLTPRRLEIPQVPADHFFIIPTNVEVRGNWNEQNNPLEPAWLAISLFRADRIDGTVYFRTEPLTRFGPLH